MLSKPLGTGTWRTRCKTMQIPCYQGKEQGIFQFQCFLADTRARKPNDFGPFREIPYLSEQGISSAKQGVSPEEQGI
jgi:hypothetical protein